MDEALAERVTRAVLGRLEAQEPAALLIGNPPPDTLGYRLVEAPPYDAVLLGSLAPGALLRFDDERVLDALLTGKPVYLWEDGLGHRAQGRCANHALFSQLLAAERRLLQWGVRFYGSGHGRKLVTAADARLLKQQRKSPAPGAVLTPMAREILEGNGL